MRATHVLDHGQIDAVELLLTGCLRPLEGFTEELPLLVPPALPVQVGEELELHDAEGVPIAVVRVETPPPAVTGPLTELAGVSHDDALDLRLSPREVQATAGGRAAVGLLLDQPLDEHQLEALASAALHRDADVLLLCPLGAHEVGDAAWFGRAAAARAGADLVRAALRGTASRVTLVAVPPPPRPDLAEVVLRAYGAEPLAPAPSPGTLPTAVSEQLARFARTGAVRGAVLLFSGLSGSGKSTVARAVAARLMEEGHRRVTLLDGDVVRRHLSSELTFSPEHRDLNVRRIAWVAAEVARHGGTAIACPIAPYDAARQAAREMAEQAGAVFLLVHVATPLEVCEQRDRKGLYALARAGKIPSFTGVSDPYEVPEHPDLRLDTSQTSLEECVEQTLAAMRGHDLLA